MLATSLKWPMSGPSHHHVRFPPGLSDDHCHSGGVTTAIRTPDTLEFDRCYRAVSSRDARFDGQFFVAVHTTGIYCRPSCSAQTPRPHNVHFVLTAAAAQQEGFRACRRCAPDAVPGSPLWNCGADLSSRAMRLITDGVVERDGVDGLATRLGYTPRHLNRVLAAQLGAGPLALARAHRAATARVLIQCTAMPMSDIAFAAGFTSVRQFNDTIREVFGLTPSRLRTLPSPSRTAEASAVGEVTLRLAYRPPLDTRWLHWFLASHATAGVEIVDTLDDGRWRYRRAIDLPHGPALVTVEPTPSHVVARIAHLDMRDLAVAVNRIRRLLDLDADAQSTDAALGRDPMLAPLVADAPGLRVPGAIDPAETLIRTMIGQQISVKVARHHINRLTGELGRTPRWATEAGHDRRGSGVEDGDAAHWLLFPEPAAIAEHGRRILTGPRRRVDAVIGAASALAEHRIDLHPGCSTDDMRTALLECPGVGRWTADYVAMRVTGDPDILLDRDLVVVRAAEQLGVDLRDGAPGWSPWRSYASMHLWRRRLSVTEAILRTEISSVPTSTRQPHAGNPPIASAIDHLTSPVDTGRAGTRSTMTSTITTPSDTITGSAAGTTPDTDDTTTAQWTSVTTPDGTFTVVADAEDRVLASGWTDDPDYLVALVHRSLRPEFVRRTDGLVTVRDAVESYYSGTLSAIDTVEVRQQSGPFLMRAWTELRTVTPGDPVTYTEFAELSGEPTAVRAAAAACARNAAALFVPCHRVLRSDGTLGGFRYGLPIKQSLLDREGRRETDGTAG